MTLYLWVILVVTIIFKVSNQCDHGEVRLVGGSGQHEGRVEFCFYSQWGRVCSGSWDNDDAIVVCRQLGYSPYGSTALNGMEFGQGEGARSLDNVHCDPTRDRTLLECNQGGITYLSCCHHDAGVKCVKCRDEQRVRNVIAHIVNTPSTSNVYTVLVSWEQNLRVEKPSSFKVECSNKQHRTIIIRVGNKTLSAQLRGLLSSSYNCCVSAVYPMYIVKEVCTGINDTMSCTTCESNSANVYIVIGVVIGVLQFCWHY